MRSREYLEIAMPGSSSWMPYAPQGVKGLDDDEVYTRPVYASVNFSKLAFVIDEMGTGEL
jgi:hypothetical protein